jgi:hypothetical protein
MCRYSIVVAARIGKIIGWCAILENEGVRMNIGKPQREFVVEPLELPEPIREESEPMPREAPEPEKEPLRAS